MEYKNCPANLRIMKNAKLLFYAITFGGSCVVQQEKTDKGAYACEASSINSF